MLPCIDEEVTKLIANARTDEIVERIRDAVSSLDGACFKELTRELDIAYGTLYAFKSGRTVAPHFSTIQKLLTYFAPGYEIAVLPVNPSQTVCAVRPVPQQSASTHDTPEWRPIPTMPGWEAKYVNGKLVPGTGGVREVAPAAAAG